MRLGTPESITDASKTGTSDKINIPLTKSYYLKKEFFSLCPKISFIG